jgi:hypothetical protein
MFLFFSQRYQMPKLVYGLFLQKSVEKEKKSPKPNLAALLSQKIIVDTQPIESQITL